MIRQHCTVICSLAFASVIVGMSLADTALLAQSSPKERLGKAHWENRYSWQQTSHARNHASNLYHYSVSPLRIVPQFLKTQSEECGRNLTASQQNLAPVEKAVKGDKELESRVASIRRHLGKADAHFKKMHGECCQKTVDRKATMSCCNDLIGSLDNANKEFAALERLLLTRISTVGKDSKTKR